MTIYDYIVVVFYLAFMFLMGPVYKSFSKSASDFFRGGGGMLWWVVGSSTFMSTFSAWSFTGGAAKAYETGTFFLLLFACNIIGYVFTYFFTAARFRQMRVVTAIEAIRKRFGNTNEQVFAWLPIFANLILGGIYLYTISIFMYGVFGLPISLLIVVLGTVVCLMTLFGGSWAATAGDFVQMLIVLSITLIMVFLTLSHPQIGGFSGLMEKLPAEHMNWSLFDRPWVVILFALTLLINQLVQNNSMTTTGGAKYVFVKNGKDARRSTLISIFGYLILSPIWMIPAVAATFFHPDLAAEFPMLNNPNEAAYVAMAQTLLPAGLLGLLVCAIFAATLTTINTFLNVSSGAFVRNFYIRVVNKNASESKQILVGRIFILINGILMMLMAVYFQGLKSTPLFDLVLIAAASIGIPSTIPLFFGIFVKKTPAWSAWSTMVFGFALAIILRIILTPDFINSIFSPQMAFTGQEFNDLNIAITTGVLFVACTAWYFSSMLFYRWETKAYEQQVEAFFVEMNTPISMHEEHQEENENDSRQYNVLGRLCLIYGGFVMLLNLIPNTWESRVYISICGFLILSTGLILRIIGVKIKRKTVAGLQVMKNRISFLILFCLSSALLGQAQTKNASLADHTIEFEKIKASPDWKLQFADPGTGNWQDHWFLDGQLAKVENGESGMNFRAGPVNRNDAHHAVLWTKESFKGDLKIEYNYTRTDSQVINVNILFIQATGIGEEAFDQDISKWNDYRKVPTMSKYWRNMNLIHISYAAFPMVNEDPANDYIRVRRYPATENIAFKDTEIPPAFEKTGLFLPDVTYKMTWIKTGEQLFLKVEGDGKVRQYDWDLTAFAPITAGRIGLRHMFTRSAQYSDFKVYTRAPTTHTVQKLQNPISATYLQDHLRKESPRLVLNKEIEENLKKKLKTDPVVRNIYAGIKRNAEAVFEKSIINLDIPMEQRSQNNQLDISRDLLHRVSMLAMVYRMEKDARMLQRINEEVIAACQFPTWFPKHFLDVGEMSLGIALAIDWVGEDLPESTVELAKKALIEKGIKPSWPANGKPPRWAYGHNNWNQVCHGGMVAASIAVAEMEPELAAKTIHRAIDGMVNALAQYGPDGVYPEGATYWRYGTSFSVVTAALFESAFGTDFGMLDYPGFKESAVFRVLSVGPTGLVYNFADSGERSSRNGDITLAWFASKTGNKTYFEREKFMRPPQEMGNLSRLTAPALVWISQYEEKGEMAIPSAWSGDGPNPVVFFTGGDNDPHKYYFGGKGGRGAVSHGNMDGGSFVFELDGVRWVVDPGNTGRYGLIERTGFGLWRSCQECDRWKLLNKGNFGHSTLSVNNQLHVVDGKATIVDFKAGEKPEATIDMTPTFEGQLKSATRRFIKDGPRSLLIEDNIELSEETALITWQLMTQADVEIVKGGALLKQDGKSLKIENLSHPELTLSIISLYPPPFYLDTKKEGLKRIEIRIPAWTIEGGKMNIKVRLSGE